MVPSAKDVATKGLGSLPEEVGFLPPSKTRLILGGEMEARGQRLRSVSGQAGGQGVA
jgi:hypothetical protein